jgi:hypothetical protein
VHEIFHLTPGKLERKTIMDTATIARPCLNLLPFVAVLLVGGVCWSTISCKSEPSNQSAVDAMRETIAGEQMRVKAFGDSVRGISLVERDPDYSLSRSALVSLAADASRIFGEASAIRVKCLAGKIADGQRGHVTVQNLACDSATSRESFAIANVGTPGGWRDPHQIQPKNDADDIRPQILRWSASVAEQQVNTSPTFESSRREIECYAAGVCDPNFDPGPDLTLTGGCVHYAGTSTYPHFKADIDKAELYKRKADEAAVANDWAGGFIFLRHSQMLMDDARIRAIHDAYSRSTHSQP